VKKSLFIVILLLILVALFQPQKTHRIIFQPTPTPEPAETKEPSPRISLNGVEYAYAFIREATASSISLIPNFTEKRDAKTIRDVHACNAALNAGFYDASGKPLGYFFTDKKTYGKQIQSALVNGFFWANHDGVAVISTELPHVPMRFALQTGPILLFDGQSMPLVIQHDEPARRMVAAKTRGNTYVFLTVYDENSVFGGPLLSDLPSAVEEISNQEEFRIADAINLDGGSASAFYNGDTNLSEFTPVGSLFCVK